MKQKQSKHDRLSNKVVDNMKKILHFGFISVMVPPIPYHPVSHVSPLPLPPLKGDGRPVSRGLLLLLSKSSPSLSPSCKHIRLEAERREEEEGWT